MRLALHKLWHAPPTLLDNWGASPQVSAFENIASNGTV